MHKGVGAALGTLAVVAVGALSFAHGVHPTPAPVHYAQPVAHLHNVQTIPLTSTAVAKATAIATTTPGTAASTVGEATSWACQVDYTTKATATTTAPTTGMHVVWQGTCTGARQVLTHLTEHHYLMQTRQEVTG